MEPKQLSKKEFILKRAAYLFRKEGFRAVSMRGLATAVGMEAASLYNHIKGKQELLETICKTIADKHIDSLDIASKKSTPLEKVEMLIRLHIRVVSDSPHMTAVSHDDWRHLKEEERQSFIEKRRTYESTLKSWLEEAKSNSELRIQDVEIALYTLLSSIQWLHHWFRDDRDIPKEKIEQEIVELLLDGLKK